LEQLVTPEMKEVDAVFPAENWFLYWKTSPSLWESKLREFSGPNPIFVPIYWAIHSEYSDLYDFGQIKPETDLKKIAECGARAGKEIIFLIGISPLPFLINGGIPSYLARNLSLNKDGLAISVIDNQDRINRIYSFYDPKIFQAFRKFAWHLGQYFSQLGVSNSVYGLDAARIEDSHIVSYFQDHSAVFEGGFSRYIKQLQDSEPEKIHRLKEHPEYEKDLKAEYSELIKNLYFQAAKDALSGSWSGLIQTCLLGGSTKDIFKRSHDRWENERDYFHPLMKCVVNEVYPNSILLGHKIKRGSLGKAIKDIVSSPLIQSHLSKDYYEDDASLSFQPLVFFELNDSGKGHFSFERAMEKSGIKYFFEKEFPWSYKITKEFKLDIDDLEPHTVFFFFGGRLDSNSFNEVIKLFLSGSRIFIDMADLAENLAQKLETFFVENEIPLEKINYISPVTKAALGDGLIVTYDSDKLKETSLIKRAGFWEKMVNYLEIKNLQVQADEDVEYFWKVRQSNTYELNYEEIRRVSFYNPSSYKRKARVNTSSNFAFIKSVDLVNVEVKSTPIGIDILLLPGASVTLDFGYFDS